MNTIQERLKTIRETFITSNIDGLLVTNPTNIRWLSGFTGSYSRLLITGDKAILGTDSRYWIQAQIEAPDFELFQDKRLDENTESLLQQGGVKRIGIESKHMTIDEAEKLHSIAGYTWIPLKNLIEEFRQCKNAQELSFIESAAKITDQAMALVPQLVRVGISERELAWQLEKIMREAGAGGLAFPIIVAFGPNSALPHHDPGQRTLNEEEIVLVDMGAEFNGYKSDLTRSFFFGQMNDSFQEIFDLVLAAQNQALQGLRVGAMSGEIHQLAMDVFDDGGYGDYFPHGLGHGLGLDIHELPFLSLSRPSLPLAAGMPITVEPGVYLQDWGGVRIEDLVSITAAGFQFISKCPKQPFIHPSFTQHKT
jgi:Xaa-Pro aminopeptidase